MPTRGFGPKLPAPALRDRPGAATTSRWRRAVLAEELRPQGRDHGRRSTTVTGRPPTPTRCGRRLPPMTFTPGRRTNGWGKCNAEERVVSLGPTDREPRFRSRGPVETGARGAGRQSGPAYATRPVAGARPARAQPRPRPRLPPPRRPRLTVGLTRRPCQGGKG